MKKIPPVADKYALLAKHYEELLDKTLHQLKIQKQRATLSLEEDAKALWQIGADEAEYLQYALKRDLRDAKQYLALSNKELRFWLGFDVDMIKSELWQKFKLATDMTPIELLELTELDSTLDYHTGEIVGLGTLVCKQCNTALHFSHPGHIPPCGKCYGTRFHRLFHEI